VATPPLFDRARLLLGPVLRHVERTTAGLAAAMNLNFRSSGRHMQQATDNKSASRGVIGDEGVHRS
jgi:hypothetical protein